MYMYVNRRKALFYSNIYIQRQNRQEENGRRGMNMACKGLEGVGEETERKGTWEKKDGYRRE
jgi:hypothetical protein